MSVANNMQIEFGAVESLAANLLSVMNSENLGEITTDVYEPLFENGIATAFQATLPKACQTGDNKGKTIANLTSGTIAKEMEADEQGVAAASSMTPSQVSGAGAYELTINSSSTETDNDKDLKVRSDDEGNQFGELMKNLDAKSYIDMMQGLSSMEKEELQNYLTDLEFAPALKQWLLTSPKVDANLKEVIFDMDPATVQTQLKNILETQAPLNDLTEDVIYSIGEIGLSGEMFEDMTVASAEELIEAIGDLTGSYEFQGELQDIYNGNNKDLSEANAAFLKGIVDTISDQTGISTDELFSNTSYANPLSESLQNVSQTFAYAETVSNYSGRSIGSLLSDFTKGV